MDKYLLIEAKEEITRLRHRNEILEAQVGVMEVFGAALGFKRNEGGMTVDIAWKLQKEIDAMERPTDAATHA